MSSSTHQGRAPRRSSLSAIGVACFAGALILLRVPAAAAQGAVAGTGCADPGLRDSVVGQWVRGDHKGYRLTFAADSTVQVAAPAAGASMDSFAAPAFIGRWRLVGDTVRLNVKVQQAMRVGGRQLLAGSAVNFGSVVVVRKASHVVLVDEAELSSTDDEVYFSRVTTKSGKTGR